MDPTNTSHSTMSQSGSRRRPASGRVALLLCLTLIASGAGQAAEVATLWGYGVKPCSAFLAAAPEVPDTLRDAEYRLYREWLAGLVSGLNLATDSDVLRGAELEAALTRIRAECRKSPGSDFFSASLGLIKSLSKEGRD
jgi:hypothetical protein